jgi:hypothetical protein
MAVTTELDRKFVSGMRKAGGLVVSRHIERSSSVPGMSLNVTSIGPDPEYEFAHLTVSSMSEAEKEMAICCSDRELKEELPNLRSPTPEVRRAALLRLQNHTVFEPRDEERRPSHAEIKPARGKRGKGALGRAGQNMAKSASTPNLKR